MYAANLCFDLLAAFDPSCAYSVGSDPLTNMKPASRACSPLIRFKSDYSLLKVSLSVCISGMNSQGSLPSVFSTMTLSDVRIWNLEKWQLLPP